MKAKNFIIFLIISIAIAYPEEIKKKFGPPPPFGLQPDIVKRQLNLSEEQIDKIEEIREKIQSKILPLTQELGAKRKELINLLKKEPEPDREAIKGIFKEIADLQAKIEFLIFEDMFSQMKEVFSPKQRQKFLELLEKGLANMERTVTKDREGYPGHSEESRRGRR